MTQIKLLKDIEFMGSIIRRKGEILEATKQIKGNSYMWVVGEENESKIGLFKDEAEELEKQE